MAVQIFRAADGQEFSTLDEAERYEANAHKKKAIEAWVTKHFNNFRLTKKHTNVIMEYEMHRDQVFHA
jgi:hypothetical protein